MTESITGLAATMLEENAPTTSTGLSSAAKSALSVVSDHDRTVASYIRSARLRRAGAELDSAGGAASIRDVAERRGFASGSHFARHFQQEFGSVPSRYVRKPV